MTTSRQIRDRLWGYVKQDWRVLAIALVCAAGVGIMSLQVGILLKPFIDTAGAAHSTHFNTKNAGEFQSQITKISLSLIGIYVIRWVFVYGTTVYFAEAGQRLGLRLRSDIYQHLQGMSLAFYNKQRTGALMSTINNDVPILQGTVSSLKDLAPAPFYIIGGLIAAFIISPKLTLISFIVLPLMAISINRLSRRIRQITSQTQNKLADVNTIMEESLSGIRVIQSFSAEQHEIDRFQRENVNAKELSMSGTRQGAKLKPTTDLIGAIGIAAALWFAGHFVVSHELTLGKLGEFIFMLNQVATGLANLGGAKVTYEQVMAAGNRIFENVLNVESEVKDAPNAVILPEVSGEVEFQNVSFAYNAHTPVLKNVSFAVHPGEVIAVVGPSGAGKSTISDLIPRFYDPDSGQIVIDGHNIKDVTLASLRKQIGIVPQETVLFGGTIRDNIAYGNPKATDAMIEAAAKAANAHHFIADANILPDGYQTLVGERGKQLSGGQRQRIAIARAILHDPRILILDEATSSLDAKSEILVQEALEHLMKGRTTLVITHRLSTIPNAARILFLQEGRVAEAGTHAELMARPGGLYYQYYERHFLRDGESALMTASS